MEPVSIAVLNYDISTMTVKAVEGIAAILAVIIRGYLITQLIKNSIKNEQMGLKEKEK